jgi:glycosyltransferase involved in cell wall biosynthesis
MVVIPVYNHASTVAEIVRKSLKSGLDTLAVDDGSGPETQAALRETGVRVLRLEKNTGKGAAILAGARAAAESGHSHIITIDADMQHDPADIVKFIKKINESPTAIVAGERNLKAAGAPLSSRIGRRLSNSALKLLAGVKIPDTQCGFRAYPARLLESLGCVSRRYDFEMEVLARAARAGVPLETVKISVMYSADTQRNSNFKPFADVLRILKICLRLLLKPGPNSTKTP